MPQEKAHKQGTSSLPVFKDDSYGMQSRFLLARLISPSQTSGCSSACSCSTVRANSATAELSNTVLSHFSYISGHWKENHHLASLANARHHTSVNYLASSVTIDETIFNCTIFSTYELFMSYCSAIWMMNSLMPRSEHSDCCSKSGNNISQYLM